MVPAVCPYLLFAAAVCLIPPDAPASVHWPGWLGPRRDGIVRYPVRLPTDGARLRQRWRLEVGPAYSSPLVVDGRVYQMGRMAGKELLWCIDLEQGRPLWRRAFEVPFQVGSGGERHGDWPKSTPCYANGRVFTLAINGILRAWDARSGELLWQRDYGAQFGARHPYWGAATSPLADGDALIVHLGNDKRGALFCLDAATGEVRWRQGDDGACYSSPQLAVIDGVPQVIEWNHRAVVGVDRATGRKLWEYPLPHEGPNQNMTTPLINDETIIVGAENRGIRCLAPRRSGNRWAVEVRWFVRRLATEMSTPLVYRGRLYGLSHFDRGRLFCLDAATGRLIWLGPPRTAEYATLLAAGPYVVVLLSSGELRVLDASADRYTVVARHQITDTDCWSYPVLLPDGLLVKDHDSLVRWEVVPASR